MAQHAKNAIRVARYLEAHPKVRHVVYPGLKSHPGHEIAKRQCSGFSGMVTFRIRGDIESSRAFLKGVKVFTLAESLGAVESLAELPCIMTHASVPAEQRARVLDKLHRYTGLSKQYLDRAHLKVSTNRFRRELLRERWGDSVDSKTYIVVQKPFMLYRSFATFTKQWPGPSFAVASPAVAKLADYVDASIGMPFDAVVSAMVGDTQRLRFYSEVKDFQAAVDVPDAVWAALGRLVGLGYTSHLCAR